MDGRQFGVSVLQPVWIEKDLLDRYLIKYRTEDSIEIYGIFQHRYPYTDRQSVEEVVKKTVREIFNVANIDIVDACLDYPYRGCDMRIKLESQV